MKSSDHKWLLMRFQCDSSFDELADKVEAPDRLKRILLTLFKPTHEILNQLTQSTSAGNNGLPIKSFHGRDVINKVVNVFSSAKQASC